MRETFEQIANQLDLSLGIVVDRLQSVIAPCHGDSSTSKHVGPAENGIERRSQFVPHRREKVIFQPIGLLSFSPRQPLGFQQSIALNRMPRLMPIQGHKTPLAIR